MSPRLRVYAPLAPVIVVLALLGALAASRGLHEAALESDYMAFLTAGKLVATGHGNATQLYDRGLQASIQHTLFAGSDIQIPGGLLPFVNPPLLALPFALLSYFPIGAGFVLWNMVQLVALLIALWLLQTMLPPNQRYLLWLGASIFLPIYQSMFQAQLSPLLLLSVTLLWKGLHSGGAGDWWAGAALGLMLFKPQLLPVFLLFLLYKRNVRALAGFAGAAVGAYLLSALVAGFGWLGSYLDMLTWYGSIPDPTGNLPRMPTILGVLTTIGISNDVLLLALSLLLIATFIYACWRSDRHSQNQPPQVVGRLELQLAAANLVAALTSLHLHEHDFTVVLFSGAVLLGWAVQHGWPGWVGVLLLLNLIAPASISLASPFHLVFAFALLLAFIALLYLQFNPSPRQSWLENPSPDLL